MSDLPGLRLPPTAGRWPARDTVATYLRDYERWHDLEVRRGVAARRVDATEDRASVELHDGSVESGDAAVVATGHSAVPHTPDWIGAEAFRGTIRHSADYVTPRALPSGRVLVVGAGSSGGEIALDLLAGGRDVVWSVRTAPHVFPREIAGIPTTPFGALADLLPRSWVDGGASWVERAIHGPRDYLPAPPAPLSELLARNKEPMTADGIVNAVRAGRVPVVPAVDRFERGSVVLVDGSRIAADVVIAATGFRAGLEPLVGHLDILDRTGRPAGATPLPRLGFVGYRTPLGGTLWAMERDARHVLAHLDRT